MPSRRPNRAQSRVLLVGAGRFDSDLLTPIPSVIRGLEAIQHALTDPQTGVFDDDEVHCRVVRNPTRQAELFDALYTSSAEASDVLLVYYAGHGLLDQEGRLHLAVRESNPLQPVGNSVEFDRVNRRLEASAARLRILILDCCYSGQAVGRQAATVAVDDAAHAVAQVVATDAAGMYVLTSADREQESRYAKDEPYTAFTGALVRALEPDPEREKLLGEIYPDIARELERRRFPEPQTTVGNTSGNLVVRRAGGSGPEPPPTAAPVSRRRTLMLTAVAAVVAGATTVGVAVAANMATGAPSGVGSSTQPVVTSAALPTSASGVGAVFADDFSGPSLDPSKWNAPARPDVVMQADGHLNLKARPNQNVDTQLDPILRGGPFNDLTFTVTVPAFAQAGKGGGSLVVNGNGQQPQILAFGPSPGGPSIYPLTCDAPSCRLGVYEDYTEPANFGLAPIQLGVPIAVQVVRNNGRLHFFADGIEIGATAGDPGPLTDFRFTASAEAAESWDIQIDDVVAR